jgi:hypothetical protein
MLLLGETDGARRDEREHCYSSKTTRSVTLNELGGVDRHLVSRQNVRKGGKFHEAVSSLSVL